jgi:hypothetical protein
VGGQALLQGRAQAEACEELRVNSVSIQLPPSSPGQADGGLAVQGYEWCRLEFGCELVGVQSGAGAWLTHA